MFWDCSVIQLAVSSKVFKFFFVLQFKRKEDSFTTHWETGIQTVTGG